MIFIPYNFNFPSGTPNRKNFTEGTIESFEKFSNILNAIFEFKHGFKSMIRNESKKDVLCSVFITKSLSKQKIKNNLYIKY